MATVIAIDGRQEAGKAQQAQPSFMVLPSVQTMFDIFEQCREDKLLGLVIAPPGFGKTTNITEYIARDGDLSLIPVTPTPFSEAPKKNKCPKDFLCLVAKAMNIGGDFRGRSVQGVYEAIKWHLDGRYRQPFLIIDEANLLHPTSFSAVRALWDLHGIGIVLVGTPDMGDNLKELHNKHPGIYRPLISRIRPWAKLSLEDQDVFAFVAPYGLDARSRKFLAGISRIGGLRTVGGVLRVARKLAGDGPIGLQHLQAAATIDGAGS